MGDFDIVSEWLKVGKRDYEIAVHLNEYFRPLPLENICYNCQQATEKAMKSILILHTGDYQRTHDIESLHEQCKAAGIDFGLTSNMTRTLTRFAKKSRYPDDVYDFTESDVEIALKYAKRVLIQAEDTFIKIKEKAELTKSPLRT
jgi:HEPN domain-containing protein